MLSNPTMDKLYALRLDGMAQGLEEQRRQADAGLQAAVHAEAELEGLTDLGQLLHAPGTTPVPRVGQDDIDGPLGRDPLVQSTTLAEARPWTRSRSGRSKSMNSSATCGLTLRLPRLRNWLP